MRMNGPLKKSRNAAFQELNPSGNYDNMSSEELEALIGGLKEEMKRKELLSNYPITQLSNGKWYIRLEDGKKIERANRSDVEDALLSLIYHDNDTLHSIFPDFLMRRKCTVCARTWAKDKKLYDKFILGSPIDEKSLKKLTINDAYIFLDHCRKIKPDLRYRYWLNITTTLNRLFMDCIQRGIISMNPFSTFSPSKELFHSAKYTEDKDTVFTEEELEKITKIALEDSQKKNSALPLGILIIKHLGIRDGELCALKWGDIESRSTYTAIHIQRELVSSVTKEGDLIGFEIVNHCKTPSGNRYIPLSEKCQELFRLIKQYNDSNGIPTGNSDLIFQRIRKGKIQVCSPRCFYGRFARYCREAGMDVIKSPHDMRRTLITSLNDKQMNIKKIQQIAGHSSLAQTMQYIRHRDYTETDLSIMEKL